MVMERGPRGIRLRILHESVEAAYLDIRIGIEGGGCVSINGINRRGTVGKVRAWHMLCQKIPCAILSEVDSDRLYFYFGSRIPHLVFLLREAAMVRGLDGDAVRERISPLS